MFETTLLLVGDEIFLEEVVNGADFLVGGYLGMMRSAGYFCILMTKSLEVMEKDTRRERKF